MARAAASLKSTVEALLDEGEGFISEFNKLEGITVDEREVPKEIAVILEDFDAIFQTPQGLPPHRRQDHSITLKEGSDVSNLRPYRYPHHPKTEIERLVSEMLKAGIFRDSSSSYSSPIILVEKKMAVGVFV